MRVVVVGYVHLANTCMQTHGYIHIAGSHAAWKQTLACNPAVNVTCMPIPLFHSHVYAHTVAQRPSGQEGSGLAVLVEAMGGGLEDS